MGSYSKALTRIIHECPTATDDPLAVAVRTRSGPLDIVHSYACAPCGRVGSFAHAKLLGRTH